MSLAATTTTALTIIDGASLKRHATSYDFRKTPVLATPSAHAWSPDNGTLYLVSSDTLHAFSPSSCTFTTLYTSPAGLTLQPALASKDKSTLIFAQGSAIHLLAVGSSSPRITGSLRGHSSPVTALSLCNDASLLASASASGTLCVHNLAHNSLTVLKGAPTTPPSSSKSLICMFHPHTRTRLLVGCGKTLVIYDTTRPSAPIKTILLFEKDSSIQKSGNVVAISCSPFSKTLTAVAFNSGVIALIDLEKDRPLFKNLQLKIPITSMTFTADGTSVAVGTENGKVIVQDLRAMDHEHRTLPVCGEGRGERIIGISIQRRIKTSPSTSSAAATKKATTTAKLPTSLSVPLATIDLNNHSNAIAKSPTRRVLSSSPNVKARAKVVTPIKNRPTTDEPPRRAFSPPKLAAVDDGGGNISIQIQTLTGDPVVEVRKDRETERNPPNAPRRSRLSVSRSTSSPVPRAASVNSKTRLVPSAAATDRPSSRSGVTSRSVSTKAPITRTTSSRGAEPPRMPSASSSSGKIVEKHSTRTISPSEDGTRSRARQVSLSVPSVSSEQSCRTSGASTDASRTPTPDLPSVDEGPPPVWRDGLKNLDAALNAPGTLSTPAMERWVEAGRGKQVCNTANLAGKHVGWADTDGSSSSMRETGEELGSDEDNPTILAAYKGKDQAEIKPTSCLLETMNMSPLRRPHIPLTALQVSPLRSSPLRVTAGGSNSTESGGAQELLRAVVKDVMYEYRQETREDIKGLHLDLLRMGRSWKMELRSLMDEYVGDFRELREENAKLRKENERLRRGF
ncbi:WD40-repeat-containing domain protein [Gautieria morchelliformis]|nr:WD40-repeat-containing domain protein [Gautieria morchelliformis]